MMSARSSIKAVIASVAMTCSVAWAAEIPHPEVHFQTNSTELSTEDLGPLNDNVAWLQDNPQAVVILEGHCDERGTPQYNMELGDRRAREIKARLIAAGIVPERVIMVVSFGEFRPIDARRTLAAFQTNRRVEFVLR